MHKVSSKRQVTLPKDLCDQTGITERPTSDETGKKLKLPDFPDTFSIYKAKQIAKQWGEPIEAVYSFDSGALRVRGTKHP